MNKIILMGRLTRDPEIYYSQGEKPIAIARFTIAIEKKQKREDGATADFFQMVSFGKGAEFAEKYLKKGIKMLFIGRVQTGYYQKNGISIPFFEVVIEEQEFAESKNVNRHSDNDYDSHHRSSVDSNGFMNIPDDIDMELPFE